MAYLGSTYNAPRVNSTDYDSGEGEVFMPIRRSAPVAPAPVVETYPAYGAAPVASQIVETNLPPAAPAGGALQTAVAAAAAPQRRGRTRTYRPPVPTNSTAGRSTYYNVNTNPDPGTVYGGLGNPQLLTGYPSGNPHVLYGGLMDTTFPYMNIVNGILNGLRGGQSTAMGEALARGVPAPMPTLNERGSGGGGGATKPQAQPAAPAQPLSNAENVILGRMPTTPDGQWGPSTVERSVAQGMDALLSGAYTARRASQPPINPGLFDWGDTDVQQTMSTMTPEGEEAFKLGLMAVMPWGLGMLGRGLFGTSVLSAEPVAQAALPSAAARLALPAASSAAAPVAASGTAASGSLLGAVARNALPAGAGASVPFFFPGNTPPPSPTPVTPGPVTPPLGGAGGVGLPPSSVSRTVGPWSQNILQGIFQ